MLVTVLPLASESRELREPLMCEPLDSRELPEGKGSLATGDRQRGTPPRLEQEPVGESRSPPGPAAAEHVCGAAAVAARSTSSPFSEPASELTSPKIQDGLLSDAQQLQKQSPAMRFLSVRLL